MLTIGRSERKVRRI